MNLFYYILALLSIMAGAFVLFHLSVILILIIFALPVSTKKTYDKPSPLYHNLFNFAYWYLIFSSRTRVHVTGLEKIPQDENFMFISNHRSKFDNMIHSYCMKKYNLSFISKKENFKIPIGKHYMARNCYLSLDRNNVRQGAEVIATAINYIKEGITNIGVFPEGTRSNDLQVHEFHAGTFKIAVRANCPIVVGVIQGTENIHKYFPLRKSDVYFDIVEVIKPEDFSGMNTIQIAERCQKIVEKNLKK